MERAQNNPPRFKVKRRRNRPASAPSITLTVGQWKHLLILLLALIGLALVIAPWLGLLPDNLGLIWIGISLTLFALIAVVIQLRIQLVRHKGWWRNGGCPSCGVNALKRTRRTRLDRLIGLLGVPRRRYVCTECGWQGARIDESHLF